MKLTIILIGLILLQLSLSPTGHARLPGRSIAAVEPASIPIQKVRELGRGNPYRLAVSAGMLRYAMGSGVLTVLRNDMRFTNASAFAFQAAGVDATFIAFSGHQIFESGKAKFPLRAVQFYSLKCRNTYQIDPDFLIVGSTQHIRSFEDDTDASISGRDYVILKLSEKLCGDDAFYQARLLSEISKEAIDRPRSIASVGVFDCDLLPSNLWAGIRKCPLNGSQFVALVSFCEPLETMVTREKGILLHSCDSSPGFSGGPLVFFDGSTDQMFVLGIHRGAARPRSKNANEASLFTSSLLDQLASRR